MNKQSLKILEQAFEAEISGALDNGSGLFQTKSKMANKLVESGHLVEHSFVLSGRLPIQITGYILTDLGRIEYCDSVR